MITHYYRIREPSSAAVSVCAFAAVCQPVVCIVCVCSLSVCTEGGVKLCVCVCVHIFHT